MKSKTLKPQETIHKLKKKKSKQNNETTKRARKAEQQT